MDGIDLVSIVSGDVFANDRNGDREALVDDRTVRHASRSATEKLRYGGNRTQGLDAGTKLRALRWSEIRFEPEVYGVNEHDEKNRSDLALGVELCLRAKTIVTYPRLALNHWPGGKRTTRLSRRSIQSRSLRSLRWPEAFTLIPKTLDHEGRRLGRQAALVALN